MSTKHTATETYICLADKCRFGLLPQHIISPSPSGRYKANRRSGARTCESVCEGAERVAGAGVRGVPARGNHTAIESTPSLFVRGSQRWRASETYAGGRGFKKAAFTLAEVLITLVIIGVVAALNLPTLIAKVNEKVDGNQKKVTEAKLIQGLNMLDLHGGINNTYSSTAEFVEELSKYMKITKICDGTNSAFTECIPYNEIKYTDSDNEEQTVDVVDLNTAASLGKGDTESGEEFMAPVAMVLADGTPIILTYNKNCISDPDSIDTKNKTIHPCVAGIYDLNGSRTPNKYGKDLTAFNGGTINIIAAEGGGGGGSETQAATIATIAGYNIIKQTDRLTSPPAMDCSTYLGNSKYPEITHCPYSGESDYWVGAVVTCRDMGGHLPTMTELANIAKVIYPSKASSISAYDSGVSASWDTTEVAKLGIDPSSVSTFYLWSSEEYSSTSSLSRYRYFDSGYTSGSYYTSRYDVHPEVRLPSEPLSRGCSRCQQV